MNAKYRIGKEEKHEMEIDFTRWLRKLKVKIDGVEAEKWDSLLNGDIVGFEAGNNEKHRVDFKIGGTFVPRLSIYVDKEPLAMDV